MTYLITGGAGFIGSALARALIKQTKEKVVVLDKLSYSGSLSNLETILDSPNLVFLQHDILDEASVLAALYAYQPKFIFHLAAESHVDRSLDDDKPFISTNILGTWHLLKACKAYQEKSSQDFFFVHMSTDEVFGSAKQNEFFNINSNYAPSSPYSASKAAADQLVHGFLKTYQFPAAIVHCCNNYGPYQFPEKLIPRMILRALRGESLPVYGSGQHEREWIYVDDCVDALIEIAHHKKIGARYLIGSSAVITNIQLVEKLASILDEHYAHMLKKSARRSIEYVTDRLGHDLRYAIGEETQRGFSWAPKYSLDQGLKLTIDWYLQHRDWLAKIEDHYQGQRLGLE